MEDHQSGFLNIIEKIMLVNPMFSSGYVLFKNINLNHRGMLNNIKKEKYIPIEDHSCYSLISERRNFLDKETKKIFKFYIDKAIKDGFKFNIDHDIVNSWTTKCKPNAFSHSHIHKNFWITAVYYPYSELKYLIEFESKRYDWGNYDIPVNEYNNYNSSWWTQEMGSGDLIVFSANIEHRIPINKTNQTRYSLAMNILPKGKIGVSDSEVTI
jgi:hypothetical protein